MTIAVDTMYAVAVLAYGERLPVAVIARRLELPRHVVRVALEALSRQGRAEKALAGAEVQR